MELNYHQPVSNNNNNQNQNWFWDGGYPPSQQQPYYYYYDNNNNNNDYPSLQNSNSNLNQDYTCTVSYFDAQPLDSKIYPPIENGFINQSLSPPPPPPPQSSSVIYPSFEEQSPITLPALEELCDLDTLFDELEKTPIQEFFATDDNDLTNLLANVDFDDSFNFDTSILITDTTTNTSFVNNNNTEDQSSYYEPDLQPTSLQWKRKTSIDSSGYFSSDYSETSPFSSPSSSASCCSSSTSQSFGVDGSPKKQRNRRSKHTREERKERKKNSNKKAALRYRSKKKVELETHEQILEQLEQRKNQLQSQYKKIETEFNVILPLAKAAFQHDRIRSVQLQKLLSRLSENIF